MMNYRTFFVILLSIFTQSYCDEITNQTEVLTTNKLSRMIVDKHNTPTPTLLKILDETGIKHDGTLKTIVAETQKKWLRPAGQERWEINQDLLTFTSDSLPQLFKDICLIQEIKPLKQHYTYAILHGATVHSVRNRLAYLIKLWNSGIRFDCIIIFSGKRPLNSIIERSETLSDTNSTSLPFKQNWKFDGQLPNTETEMIKLVFDQFDIPMEWNIIPIIFVDTPMQVSQNGIPRRPNTQDTVEEWLKKYQPQEGSILAISNQPYIGYQDAVLRKLVSKNFAVETVGSACSDDITTTIILDSLVRWIYTEYQNQSN